MSDNTLCPDKKNIGHMEVKILKAVTSLSDQFSTKENELLSIWGMTVLQYDALLVLYRKDIQQTGLSNKEVKEGLNVRVPDITRLLDRLAKKGWVVRERDSKNRRVVRTKLTLIGRELVISASSPLNELQKDSLNCLDNQEKKSLLLLLNKVLSSH